MAKRRGSKLGLTTSELDKLCLHLMKASSFSAVKKFAMEVTCVDSAKPMKKYTGRY